MKKFLLGLLTISFIGCAAHAGETKVTWQDPDNYTDIREGNELRESFREQLFKDFELIFADLAKQLPHGYLFEVTVTDVDLAGEVNRMNEMRGRSLENIRIVKNIYRPRIAFNYTLTNAAQGLVASGKEDIRDNAFLSSDGSPGKTRFGYEEKMLKNWFKKQQREKKFPVKEKPGKKASS
jgi:Protein of unknown function (DUF3016)